MAARRDDGRVAAQTGRGQHVGQHVSQHGARRHDFRQDARGQVQLRHEAGRPAAVAPVEELGGGRDGVLGDLAPGEPVVKQVRHHQQRVGEIEQRVSAVSHAVQLEDGIELHELDAGDVKDDVAGHDAENDLRHAVCACIAVVHWIAQQPSGAIQ